MKGLILLCALLCLRMEPVQAQLYAETHTVWLTEGKIPYYLVFQDSIAFLEIKPRKDGKGYHNYDRLDTLSKVDSKRYLGKRNVLSNSGENWILHGINDDENIAVFQLANRDQYSKWMAVVNWNQWIQVVVRTRKLFPEKYYSLSQEFIRLENIRYATPVLEYQRELQRFEKKYLDGK